MSQFDIISDEETDAGILLDNNFDSDALCNGDTCRHSECDCWTSFRLAVREQLEKQKETMTEVSECCKAQLYDDNEFCVECRRSEPDTVWI